MFPIETYFQLIPHFYVVPALHYVKMLLCYFNTTLIRTKHHGIQECANV